MFPPATFLEPTKKIAGFDRHRLGYGFRRKLPGAKDSSHPKDSCPCIERIRKSPLSGKAIFNSGSGMYFSCNYNNFQVAGACESVIPEER